MIFRRWIQAWSWVQWGATGLVLFTASWWWRPFWLRSSDSLPEILTSTRLYFIHFGFFPLVILALLAWILTGLRGLNRLASSGNIFWGMLLLQLAIWSIIALPPDARNREVGFSTGMQLLTTAFFALTILANAPPLRLVMIALIGGMIFQGGLAIVQTGLQTHVEFTFINDALNLQVYGLKLDPARAGVSVVQVGDVRFLRPYGLTPHPNMLAGMLVMGICAAFSLWFEHRRTAGWILALGIWALLLTFSRAAIGGLIVGIGAAIFLWCLSTFRQKNTNHRDRRNEVSQDTEFLKFFSVSPVSLWLKKSFSGFVFLMVLIGIVFYGIYAPLIRVRSSAAARENTIEGISTAARAIYWDQAIELIKENPWRGVGIANFAWESAFMLQFDPRDLRGDHVHNIYLLIMAELGVVGFAIFMGAILLGSGLILWRTWQGNLSPAKIGLFAGVVAWLALGWFDHYPWSQFGDLLLFWGTFAATLHLEDQENIRTTELQSSQSF